MFSKIKIFGHPVHPMLVAFPIVFYTVAFMAFIVYASNADAFWFRVAYDSNVAGVVSALVAALPGFLDWVLGIPRGTPASSRGLLHMTLNVTALILFASNAFMLRGTSLETPPSVGLNIALAGIGTLLTMIAGYHGFALISVNHVGVEPQQRMEKPREKKPPEDQNRRAAG